MVVIAVRKKVISNALHSDFKSALCARYTRNDHRSIRKCKQFGTVQARSMLFYQYLKTVMVKKRHLAVYSDPNKEKKTSARSILFLSRDRYFLLRTRKSI